jgi:hypothetical protein
VHIEFLMCYMCGSVDIQFLHVLFVVDLMDSFETSLFALVRQAVWYRYSGIQKFVGMQFCLSGVVRSCDGTRTIHNVNIEL